MRSDESDTFCRREKIMIKKENISQTSPRYVPFGILCGLADTFPYDKRLQSGYQRIISNLCKFVAILFAQLRLPFVISICY